MFETHGYPLETHEVQTEDGYILTLYRIPRGKSNPVETIEGEDVLPEVSEPRRPAVLLVHGFICCADLWFLNSNSPEKALPYLLVNEGYDCWAANLRGTPQSKSHTNLNKNSRKYWDFSMDEIAKFDIPAMINYILDITGNQSISCIGHSMGCSVLIFALSLKPDYCSKVNLMVILAPGVYLTNLRNKFLKFQQPFVLALGKFRRIYRKQLFSATMARMSKKLHLPFVSSDKVGIWMVEKFSSSSTTFGRGQVEKSGYAAIADVYPASTSVKVFSHLGQFNKSGKCQHYDYGTSGNMKKYGQSIPPVYDLSNVNTPVVTFYADGDQLCVPKDVTRLAEELPNVVGLHRISQPQFYHGDFLVGKEAVEFVYEPMIDIFRKSLITKL